MNDSEVYFVLSTVVYTKFQNLFLFLRFSNYREQSHIKKIIRWIYWNIYVCFNNEVRFIKREIYLCLKSFLSKRVKDFSIRRCVYFVAVLSIWSKSGFKFEWDGSNFPNTRAEFTPRALSSGNENFAWSFPKLSLILECRVSYSDN